MKETEQDHQDAGVLFFSEKKVVQVAEKMADIGREYEQLFMDLGRQMFNDIVDTEDASSALTVIIGHIDDAVAVFNRHFPDSSPVACVKGCHFCCSFPIECPPQVVVDVAGHLKKTVSDIDLQHLISRMNRDVRVRQPPLNRSACVFLDADHLCLIYENRPLSCRWFSSPDVNICRQSLVDGRQVPQRPVIHRIFQVATTMLSAAAKHQGRFHEQVRFIPSLLEVLALPDNETTWRGHPR